MNKVLFIGCNFRQLPYLKYLSSLGFKIIGTDRNQDAPGKNFCHKFYQVSYTEEYSFLQIGIKEKFSKEDKVFTASSQFANLVASIFAKKFGINYTSEENIRTILDKTKFYKIFQEKGIPFPKTLYIDSPNKLMKELTDINSNYYLKSDYSKNPKYVYKLEPPFNNLEKIFWGSDQYLRNYYILQKEFIGRHLRVNIYNNNFIIFDFHTNQILNEVTPKFKNLNIISPLKDLINFLDLARWVVKFDIILSDTAYVVLDIGIDPPSRLRDKITGMGFDFAKLFVDHQLFGEVNYPKL